MASFIANEARHLAESQTVFEVPFWFYLLPVIWVLLLVELYEPHAPRVEEKPSAGLPLRPFLG